MKKFNKYSIVAVIAVILAFGMTSLVKASHPPVDLGTTEDFAILAGTEITNVPTSAITGDVGLYPGSGAAIGLTCPQVDGTIYDRDGAGDPCFVTDDPLLDTAKQDLVIAYDDAASRIPVTEIATELGGQTLTDGTYDSDSTTFGITAGAGPLILDGEGDPDAVFIFLMNSGATGLTVGPGSEVQLTGEAQACNVFWKLNTATIDTTAVFKGTILALTSITVANDADIEGRLLARNAEVTLISDTITVPTCAEDVVPPVEDEDTTDTDTTPGLPDTGIAPNKGDSSWGLIAPAAIVISLGALYRSRRGQAL